MKTPDSAVLRIHCTDQKGIVAHITEFILDNGGNILKLNQHVDHAANYFYMRLEWDIKDFSIPQSKIREYFATLIASKYGMHWVINFKHSIPRMAVFVSKYSHCFFDIMSRWESKEWNVELPIVISNHEKLREATERLGIQYHHIPINKENKLNQEDKQIKLLKQHKVDFIVLARYMQILSPKLVTEYPNQIINIHHSSLPAFAGANPYGKAFDRGVKLMGATGHYVTNELDEGPIITQDVIPISHRDSIADMKRKGKDIEKTVLANAIWAHLNYNVIAHNNKTIVF